jgi:hypothetical protein
MEYEKMSVAELKKISKDRNIAIGNKKKADIIKSLKENEKMDNEKENSIEDIKKDVVDSFKDEIKQKIKNKIKNEIKSTLENEDKIEKQESDIKANKKQEQMPENFGANEALEAENAEIGKKEDMLENENKIDALEAHKNSNDIKSDNHLDINNISNKFINDKKQIKDNLPNNVNLLFKSTDCLNDSRVKIGNNKKTNNIYQEKRSVHYAFTHVKKNKNYQKHNKIKNNDLFKNRRERFGYKTDDNSYLINKEKIEARRKRFGDSCLDTKRTENVQMPEIDSKKIEERRERFNK